MSGVQDRPLDEDDLDPDPLAHVRGAGSTEARAAERVRARGGGARHAPARTAGPSLRMVLNKGFDERGLDLLHELSAAARRASWRRTRSAALLFHWPELGRQVRVEGAVERVTARRRPRRYARSRSRDSQLSALASPQSRAGARAASGSRQRVAELDARARRRRAAGARGLGRLPARPARRGSSGSTGRTACTTASATCGRRTAAGGSSASGPSPVSRPGRAGSAMPWSRSRMPSS